MSLTSSSDRNLPPVADTHQPVVLLPDASFLLHGEFERVGFDLVITNPAGEQFVVADYFAMQTPPTLMIASGAGLTPDMVASLMPNQFEGVMYAGPATSGAVLEEIGTVRFARGDVEITDRNGDVRTVGRGDPVFEGDRIETGDRSFVRISMDDGTRFNLGKNAEATLDNFEYDQDAGTGNFEAMVRVGGFEYKSGDIGEMNPDSRHSTIKTPSAFIGIRGSELEGMVDESGQTIIVHRSGILEITDINGENPVELTEPGETSVIVMDGAPTFSSQLTSEQMRVLEDNLPPPDTGEDEVQEDGEEAEGEETTGEDADQDTEPGDEEESGDDTVLSQQPSEATLSDATAIDSGETDVSGDSGTQDSGTTDTTDTTGAGETTTVDEGTTEEDPTEPTDEELPPDRPPVANPDTASVVAGETVDIGSLLLSNDEDPDANQSPALSSVDDSNAVGTATLENGVLTYTASGFEPLAEGETGSDTFTYQIVSGGLIDSAQVTVNVTGVNDPPVAADDTASTDENTSVVTGDVLANDSDVDGDNLSIVLIDTRDTAGVVTPNEDGTFIYDPDGQFDALAQGETATDSFTYAVTDGNGESDTATVRITITGTNASPVAAADSVIADEDTSLLIDNILANDSDPDGDPLTVLAIDTSATTGLVTDHGDDTFTYDANGQFEFLAVGETTTDSFTYTVSDGNDGTASATVTITIEGVNDPPVAVADTATTDENTVVVTGNVLTNDSDPDGDPLSVVAIDTSATTGVVSDNGDGTFDYDPAGQFEFLAVGETATDSFTYTVSDGNDGTGSTTVTVTIDGVNDAPVANSDAFSAAVTRTTVLDILANDSDVDGDPLTVSVAALSELAGDLVGNTDGTIDFTSNPLFDDLLDADETLTDTFSYTITDPSGATATTTATVTIGPDLSVPNAVDDDFDTLPYRSVVTGNVLENDLGGTGNLSIQDFDSRTSFGSPVIDNGDGTFTVFPQALVSFETEVPELIEEPYEEHFEYTVVDEAGETSTGEVSVLVSGFDQITRTEITTTETFNGTLSDSSDLFLNKSFVDISGNGNQIAGFLANLDRFQTAGGSDVTIGRGISNHGDLYIDGDLTLDSGVLSNFGYVEGLGTIDVSNARFVSEGGISPGGIASSVGTLTIVGDPGDPDAVTLRNTNHFHVEVNDFSAGNFDQLAIQGAAHLGGNVHVLDFTFGVSPGNSIDIITTTDGYTGQVRNFELPILFDSATELPLVIDPIQDGNVVTLEVVEPTTISDGLGAITGGPDTGEVILGTSQSDVFDLSIDAEGDAFYGAQGEDTFVISDLSFARIDAGLTTSFNTLKFTTPDFDLRGVTAYQVDGIDVVDLRDGQAGTLQLSVESALNMSSEFLFIPADPGDHIILEVDRVGFQFESFDTSSLGFGDMFFIGGENDRAEFAPFLVSQEATVQLNEAGGTIWHLGSIADDQLNGTAADEFFFGRNGVDQVNAGAGDDAVFYQADDTSVDGGDGFDSLLPDPSGRALPMDLTANNPYVGFEFIDLTGEFRSSKESNTLTLDMADVAQMGRTNLLFGDGTTQLIIEGSIDDYVFLNGQNLREGDPAGLEKGTDPRFPEFVSYSDGTNTVFVETELLGPGVNHAPVAEEDEFTTTGTKTITLDPLANDRDPDPGDTVSISSVPLTTDRGVSLIDNGDGTFDYDPTVLEPGSTTEFDGFEYTITDGTETSTGFVRIVIEGNTPPEVSFSSVRGIGIEDTAAETFTVDLLATAFDADGDELSVQNVVFDGDTSGITQDGNALIVDPSDPAYEDTSTSVFVNYDVVDGFGGTTTGSAQINIFGPANKFEGTVDNTFSTAGNWSENFVPTTSGDTALIPAGFTVTSSSFNGASHLGLGGTLQVTDGQFDTFELVMEDGSNLDIGDGLVVLVDGNARLESTSSITGAGSIDFPGGFSGESFNITMLDGYTVDGASWIWSGDLDVTGGSLAIAGTGEVTHRGGSVVVNSTDFSNAGTLTIAGDFESPTLQLHSGLDNTGTVILDDQGSITTTATIDVFGGELVNQGTIISQNTEFAGGSRQIQGDVTNEGVINVDYDLTFDTFESTFFNTPSGVINVAGGQTLTFTGGGQAFNEGLIDGTSGTDNVLDVSFVDFDNSGGVIDGFATINGTITGGEVIIGSSPGLLEINGDYNNTEESKLEIELEGNEPGTGYDQLIVSGKADLDGRLNVTLLNGFMPAVAAGFVMLMADTVEGSFTQASGLDIADDRVLDLNYADDQVELVTLAVTEAGTDNNDIISGTNGQDVFVAGAGDDLITDIGTDDITYGQDGNDTFQVHGEFKRIDGGDGVDTIQLSDTVDLGNTDPVAVDSVEVLSLQNGREDTLELDARTIKGMVDGHNDLVNMDNALVLIGEPGDLVQLNGDFAADGEQTVAINGEEVALRIFTEDDVSVLVSDSVALEINRSDGSIETVDALTEQGNDILSDSIDMSGLGPLVSDHETSGGDTFSSASAENVDLADMLDDGSNSLDALLGSDDTQGSETPLPVIDPYANYVPGLSDPLGAMGLADYSPVEV